MSFFRRNFADPEVVLRDAPGPIPWYWSVLPKLDDASWHEAGSDQLASGKFYLKNSSDEPIAILGMYCYAKAVDNDSFVVWYQRHDSGFSDSIDFIVLNLASLQAIDDVPSALKKMKAQKQCVYHKDRRATTFRMPANNPAGSFDLEFPSTMKAFEELLILGHSDSINMRRELGAAGNLCLFVVKPKMNTYEIFPQDWFNNGKLDYGYQWVTRVARDPISGKIFGEGFRVSSFVLDDSLRQIEESFPYDALFGRQDK